ncbi:hypothetical protein AWB71_02876 [Caballeronia peredens]|nr:hypothetical protein AWB71_02876 [Caballeronia peredens]
MAASKSGNRGPKFRVMFRRSEPTDDEIRPYTVFVVPSEGARTDFGFRTQVELHVGRLDDLASMVVSSFIGFIPASAGGPSDLNALESLFDSNGGSAIDSSKVGEFFTMLPALDDYRRVVGVLGTDIAARLLLAVNDIVALGAYEARSPLLKAAPGMEVFQKSFLRTSESFFAFKNAGPILRGTQMEEFGNMTQRVGLRFSLAGSEPERLLEFNFDHEADLPKRIAVMIGKNGVGKSLALGQIARSALSGDDKALIDLSNQGRVLINRLLAFAPTNESASVFPADRRKNARVWYRRFALNRVGRSRRGNGVTDTVLQVARSEERLGGDTRWRLFVSALTAISGWEHLALPRTDKTAPPVQIATLLDGREEADALELFASIDSNSDPVRMVADKGYLLSSGEISFLRFAAQASMFIENGSLLLLDEPETHLHPNFISQFVALLDGLLSRTGSAAVIATHSAYFVREVFREQVTVLRTDEQGLLTTSPLRLQTFGADVGSISYFVFGEDEPSRLAAEVEDRLLKRYQSWEQLYGRYKHELSSEMLGSLRVALESEKDEPAAEPDAGE